MDAISSPNLLLDEREPPSDNGNECSNLKKIMTVTLLTFTGFSLSASAAVFLRLRQKFVVISIIGTVLGMIVGLMLAACCKKNRSISKHLPDPVLSNLELQNSPPLPKKDPLSHSSTISDPDQAVHDPISQQLVTEQEKNLEDIAQILNQHFDSKDPKLSDENLDQILEVIDQTKLILTRQENSQQAFDHLLQEIQTQSKQDLILDEQFIEKKFNIAKVLEPLDPEQQKKRREDLQKIINQAYVNREFKQKAKLTNGETDERKLLAYLKFEVDDKSNYQNKDFVYGILQEIIPIQLQKDLYTGSLSEVKVALKVCALNARLKAVGLTTPLQVEKFQITYSLFQTFKKDMVELHSKIDLPLPAGFLLGKSSLAVRSLTADFEDLKSLYTYQILGRFFKNKEIRAKFQNDCITSEDLAKFIGNNKSYLKSHELNTKCLKALESPEKNLIAQKIAFYNQWGSYLKAEMIQGFENESEALGEGVCWAVCHRIRFIGQTQPDITTEQLATHIHITANDRYHQGTYDMKFFLRARKGSTLPAFIQKEGFEEKNVFSVQYDADEPILANCFNKYQDKLVISEGWLKVGIAMEDQIRLQGHAILVRWDTVHNHFWVIDPNVGFLAFEDKLAPEEAKKACLSFLKDLLATNYPLIFHLKGDQLISQVPNKSTTRNCSLDQQS
jgi:hypothetical protein